MGWVAKRRSAVLWCPLDSVFKISIRPHHALGTVSAFDHIFQPQGIRLALVVPAVSGQQGPRAQHAQL